MNNDKIKILLVTSRADHGGGPKHIQLLLKYLAKEFDFYIACPKDEPYFDIFSNLVGEEKIIQIPHRTFTFTDLARLKDVIKRYNINTVHSHGKGAGVYSRLLSRSIKIKCIHTFHGIHTGEYNFISKFLYLCFEKYLAKFTGKFIAVSESEKNSVVSLKITGQDKIMLIPNGVELQEKKANVNAQFKERLKLVTISRFDFAKNSELIISIFNQIKNKGMLNKFEMHFIGDGPEFGKIKRLSEQNGLSGNFKFTGLVNSTAEHLVDQFCYISTSRWEGLPFGLMEAMSAGLPVIATNVRGNRDLVEHSVNGFLYDIDKPEEAANYIIELAGDLEKWKQFSASAILKIEKNYTAKIMTEKTGQLYLNT